MRQLIKNLYMGIIRFLNLIYIKKKVQSKHIVIMMTFAEDVCPIVEALYRKGYAITVIGNEENRKYLQQFETINFLPAGNKRVLNISKHLVLQKSSLLIRII